MNITIHATLDLTFSEDDSGWYFTDTDENRTSITYESKEQALAAYKADSIEWEFPWS